MENTCDELIDTLLNFQLQNKKQLNNFADNINFQIKYMKLFHDYIKLEKKTNNDKTNKFNNSKKCPTDYPKNNMNELLSKCCSKIMSENIVPSEKIINDDLVFDRNKYDNCDIENKKTELKDYYQNIFSEFDDQIDCGGFDTDDIYARREQKREELKLAEYNMDMKLKRYYDTAVNNLKKQNIDESDPNYNELLNKEVDLLVNTNSVNTNSVNTNSNNTNSNNTNPTEPEGK